MTLYSNLRLRDGSRSGLRVDRDGRIAELAQGLEPLPDERAVDCAGHLALPLLTDAHAHLDKTLTGLPWQPHAAGPQRASRIETEKRLRRNLALPVATRAARLLARYIAFGTGAVRTHVDVDTDQGLAAVEALVRVRERYAGCVDIEIVAFPQSGLGDDGRVLSLMDDALDAGADLLGGIDPVALDGEVDRPLDALFDLAQRRGVGLDVHVHDPGENGLAEIRAMVARTAALSMQGRVTVSHGFALGAAGPDRVSRLGEAMAREGVALASHGGGASPLPPVRLLHDLGVTVVAGNDGVRDMWTPLGNGDMLERAMLLAWRAGFRTDSDLELAYAFASRAGRCLLGLDGRDLSPGAPADGFRAAWLTGLGAAPSGVLIAGGGIAMLNDPGPPG